MFFGRNWGSDLGLPSKLGRASLLVVYRAKKTNYLRRRAKLVKDKSEAMILLEG